MALNTITLTHRDNIVYHYSLNSYNPVWDCTLSLTYFVYIILNMCVQLKTIIFSQNYLIYELQSLNYKIWRKMSTLYRSLQVYQRSYSQVGHRVLSDLKRVSLLKLSDKILPGRSESESIPCRSESLHSQIVKQEMSPNSANQ